MNTRSRIALVAALVLAIVGPLALARFRLKHEVRLNNFERTVYSQAGEDGILEKIFEVVPPGPRYCIEFGAGEGREFSNVRNLILHHGWRGLLIEGDAEKATMLQENYRPYSGVRTLQAWVYPGNIELLFEDNDVPRDLDLLVIDIDSNDYYVWRAIREYRPRVVLIEYNALFPPPMKMVIAFHPSMYWNVDYHYGASLQALYELGRSKGYELVATNEAGINAFFVERRYYRRFGISDNSPARLFHHSRINQPWEIAAVREGKLPTTTDLVLEPTTVRRRFLFNH